MEKISILVVNYNSSDFVENIFFSLKSLTDNRFKVFVLDNNSKKNDFHKLFETVGKYEKTFSINLERDENNKLVGSLAHGTALNHLVSKVDTDYFCIMDADAVWLKKGWDLILLKEFNDKIKAVGTQADSPEKPLDFPLMFAALFETETFKKLDIDMRPKNLETHLDTGHEIREKFLQAGFSGKVIEYKNTRTYKQGPFKNIPAVIEYYLDGILFASHFGRGSNPFGKNILKVRLPFIGPLINYIYWHLDKKKWINTCQALIKKQSYR